MTALAPLEPASLTSLHAVAEHVLAPALYRATGHIGLRVAPGGFSTPPFGPEGRTVAVEGVSLVVTGPGVQQRAPLTTLSAAAELAGVRPGAPESVFTPSTRCDPDAPLEIDPDSASRLAAWYALADAALRAWAAQLTPADPATVTLWPEHFDAAIRAGDVNYGASPGDNTQRSPYLYVGPNADRMTADPFWNAPFGAAISWEAITTAEDAVRFFRAGHAALGRR